MIRVVIVDDHAVVRSGLERLLSTADDIIVVGAAANGREAIALVDEVEPDVVMMDLSMPQLDGGRGDAADRGDAPGHGRRRSDFLLRHRTDHGRTAGGRRRLSAQGRGA